MKKAMSITTKEECMATKEVNYYCPKQFKYNYIHP